jgi:hypothetical protein
VLAADEAVGLEPRVGGPDGVHVHFGGVGELAHAGEAVPLAQAPVGHRRSDALHQLAAQRHTARPVDASVQ